MARLNRLDLQAGLFALLDHVGPQHDPGASGGIVIEEDGGVSFELGHVLNAGTNFAKHRGQIPVFARRCHQRALGRLKDIASGKAEVYLRQCRCEISSHYPPETDSW